MKHQLLLLYQFTRRILPRNHFTPHTTAEWVISVPNTNVQGKVHYDIWGLTCVW